MPTVDVVIPCYNYARYLRTCVHSVFSQPGLNVRVLVIDDASTDDTPLIGSELAASDPRVEFRRHGVNKGHIATYNEGLLEWSTGDYCVLLSADDLLVPGSLGRAVRIMEQDKRIGMVYGYAFQFEKNEDLPRFANRERRYTRWSGAEWLEGRCRTGHNVISSPEVVVRGAIQRAIGGYRPELPHAGDLEMWLRISAVSDVAYVRGVPQACYRVHPQSMLRSSYNSALSDLRQRKEAFDLFFREHHTKVAESHRLQELADRGLARSALWAACSAYDRNEVKESAAEELEHFAIATYPRVVSLGAHAALRRRRRLGPLLCNRTQIFAAPRLVRRVHRWFRYERWKRRGI